MTMKSDLGNLFIKFELPGETKRHMAQACRLWSNVTGYRYSMAGVLREMCERFVAETKRLGPEGIKALNDREPPNPR